MIVNTRKEYSPTNLADFIFPNEEVREMVMAYASGQLELPLILHGTSGTGKTLLQMLIPNAIESKEASLNKVLCADLKSAKDIHNLYGNNKQFNSSFTINDQRFNYIIIEEFLMKAKKSVDAMKIELDATIGTDMTIMSTNRLHEVDSGIISRCEVLHVPPCSPSVFLPHAKKIMAAVGVSLDDGVLFDRLDLIHKLHADNRKYYSALDHMIRTH